MTNTFPHAAFLLCKPSAAERSRGINHCLGLAAHQLVMSLGWTPSKNRVLFLPVPLRTWLHRHESAHPRDALLQQMLCQPSSSQVAQRSRGSSSACQHECLSTLPLMKIKYKRQYLQMQPTSMDRAFSKTKRVTHLFLLRYE